MKRISVEEIGGFRLGNAENIEKGTGCTVIVCEEGAVGGVDVRGGAPATRETDLLRSENTVNSVNAVVISGGSAFGLEASSGVMRELADRDIGFDVGDGLHVPIVCGASLYDLPLGDHKAFPDVEMGREAVRNAYDGIFANGNHGAGTGASVGKMKGYDRAMKSGLGTFAIGDGFIEVGAIAAVNAVGDIYNGAGNIIAGLRSEDGSSIYGTIKTLKGMVHNSVSLVDDSTTFINKAEIEEALAAAAKQYEEETAAPVAVDEAVTEEPADTEAFADIPEPESSDESAAESPEEEYFEEAAEEVLIEEEPAAAVVAEEHAEEVLISDDQAAEKAAEDQPEEFTAETPEKDLHEEAVIVTEEVVEEALDESEEAPAALHAEESYEMIPAAVQEEESYEMMPEAVQEEQPAGDAPADELQSEDQSEQHSVEPAEAEMIEEPVVLTREEMGYDITFNTTISCIITNAILTKSQANKLASILHDAYARAIKPVHGTMDGDTIFVLATGKQEVNFDALAALATDVLQYAVIDGALSAKGAYGLPAARDM